MRKLIVCSLMSLDGYFEGPGKSFMVMPADQTFDAYCAERLRSASTLLLGRTTFDMFHGFWPAVAENPAASADQREISRRDNEIHKVVVSDGPPLDSSAPWAATTTIVSRAEAPKRVAGLKDEPGEDILVFGSRTLWNELLAHGLVDELHVMLGPTVLGAGTPSFDAHPGISLRRSGIRTYEDSGNVVLQYEVSS